MKCNNCGNEFEGSFCDKCGTKATIQNKNQNFEKAKALLIDPAEEVKSILCNNFMQTFISTGILGNGFAILTDKRVYFKGKCFFRKGRGVYSKIGEKTVDLKDVTGTGFVHNKATWAGIAKTVSLVVLALFSLMFIAVLLNLLLNGRVETDLFSSTLVAVLICGALYMTFNFIYNAYNYSVFEISYAGGSIAFDMNWITQQESKEFQQQLVLLKQIEKETTKPFIHVKSENHTSIPQQLKEYKELLDSGIITQEEFDAKKKELLTK